jgi:hypothetical protein
MPTDLDAMARDLTTRICDGYATPDNGMRADPCLPEYVLDALRAAFALGLKEMGNHIRSLDPRALLDPRS